ncbi:MAG TPA: RNA 2',3'-cyclic phosphodiesterase [Gaiellaceae bacterium]|nr:RNA 2',3'-cyclic phosphodiesterase [Gaiellaceae bacterium]
MTNREAGPASVEGGDRIRLFCALDLPDSARSELSAWAARSLRERGRLVPLENLHVTLAFLGHRPAGEVPAILEELRAAAAAARPAALQPLRYRETRSVGMIVLDDVGGVAAALADDLHGRLERLGVYRREGRPWLPHVTVLRRPERGGGRPTLANRCSIHVVRSALYRSSLAAGGARYDALETAALGGT